MTIDDRLERLVGRHEALAQTVEMMSRDIGQLLETAKHDGENIRALARIAEIHERSLTQLEGGE